MSKEIQEHVRKNPDAKVKDIMKLFGAKRGQVDYAKRVVANGDSCPETMKEVDDYLKDSLSSPPTKRKRRTTRKKRTTSAQPADFFLTGETVTISTATIVSLLQTADDRTAETLFQVLRQR